MPKYKISRFVDREKAVKYTAGFMRNLNNRVKASFGIELTYKIWLTSVDKTDTINVIIYNSSEDCDKVIFKELSGKITDLDKLYEKIEDCVIN